MFKSVMKGHNPQQSHLHHLNAVQYERNPSIGFRDMLWERLCRQMTRVDAGG